MVKFFVNLFAFVIVGVIVIRLAQGAAGFILYYAAWIVGILVLAGVSVLAGWMAYGWIEAQRKYLAESRQEREDIRQRADEQHNATMQGDPHGTYGEYPPAI